MISFALWYLVITLLGIITFPLAFRFLSALPDRGYGISRVLGLLIWGYGYWLLGSLGLLQNNQYGLFFALGIILALSIWSFPKSNQSNYKKWWEKHRGMVLIGEIIFVGAFAGWTIIRSANPEIASTEKPMELAFVNAILRSPTFPPHDPWLSGYAISYYYFGYVMIAMLSMLTNVPTGVTFNLGISLIFALSALGAYSIIYNLLDLLNKKRREVGDKQFANKDNKPSPIVNAFYALLGPFFVLILSNCEGFLEMIHARGLFWRPGSDGLLTSRFWAWLSIKNLTEPPQMPFSWIPSRFWWWWRASRVVGDVNYLGQPQEVIDEFPFFSFLLADMHPHVLAIPFAFLAILLALNLFLGGAEGILKTFKFRLHISKSAFVLSALSLGGLAFLNTWDFPIYVAIFSGAFALRRALKEGWGWPRIVDFLHISISLVIAGVILYLPFYIGFSSQAGGLLPNLINPTRGVHLWVMFGTLFVPLLTFILYLWPPYGLRILLRRGLPITLVLVLGLWIFSSLLAGAIALLPEGKSAAQMLGAPDAFALVVESFIRRVEAIGGLATLITLLAMALAIVVRFSDHLRENGQEGGHELGDSPGITFSFLLIITAALLVLVPEFIYLRDQFGTRMNTVFKFYYQGWLLWGLAAAFGTAVMFQRLQGIRGIVLRTAIVLIFGVGVIYPVFSLSNRTDNFQPTNGWGLDGTRLSYLNGDDVAAVNWLKDAPLGTLVEAVGGSYSGYARISGHSGMPSLLGWPGHESQWRGGATEMGSRQQDIEQIYRSGSWAETEALLEKYDVSYVYVGPLEKSTYGVNEEKFRRFLEPIFQQGLVTIYQVP